jgi:hypothetical protein
MTANRDGNNNDGNDGACNGNGDEDSDGDGSLLAQMHKCKYKNCSLTAHSCKTQKMVEKDIPIHTGSLRMHTENPCMC